MRMLTIHNPPNPRVDDFCNAVEGELAMIPTLVCDRPDGSCGCATVHTAGSTHMRRPPR